VDVIHNDQLREHGGLPGLRDEWLESRWRVQQKWHYADTTTPMLAAAYAFGGGHPTDGNKRIGFLAMATFPGLNGHELDATDAEVVAEVVALADGVISEEALADWIRRHSTKRV
jgi:death-on-curing protein